MRQTHARRARVDQCMCGLMEENREEQMQPVMKPTGIMTNSEIVASPLTRRCDGRHEHTKLEGKHRRGEVKARNAQVYTLGLAKANAREVKKQIEANESRMAILCTFDEGSDDWRRLERPAEEEDRTDKILWKAFDDVTRKELDP